MNRNFTAFCAAMLAFAILLVVCGSYGIRNNSIALADGTDKAVYLTFDDGPSDRVTPTVLDVLKEENVKATFFIIGRQAETRKYLIEREFKEGHTVAVHSYSHNYSLIYSSAQELLKDIDKCNKIIKEVTGSYSDLYRFPGGSYGVNKKLISAVTEKGFRYVDWNASTRDAELYEPTPYQLYKSTIATSANAQKVVLLAHDSTTKTATAAALKDIIKYFKENGYKFMTF